MMRKLMAMLLALMLLIPAAQAEVFTLHKGEDDYDWMDMNLYYVAERFEGEAPAVLQGALSASPFAGDEVVQGVLLQTYYFRLEGEMDVLGDQAALMAVRHGDRTVLLGAARIGGEWVVRLQSETFLRDGEDFLITAVPVRAKAAPSASVAVIYGDERYLISTGSPDQPWTMHEYQHLYAGGVVESIAMNYGSISWQRTSPDAPMQHESFHCVLPGYLELLDADEVPHSHQELEAWAQAHPIRLDAGEAYMGGANLRTQATGGSRSHGQYLSPVKVAALGQKPGRQFPWYNVRVGDTEGWVSGAYFYTMDTDATNLCMAVNRMQPVGRLKAAASLLRTPGGEALASLPAETEVHVLVTSGSWAHVVVPRGELGWHADWDGDYGYVPVKSLTMAASPLQLRQTED